MRTFTAPTAVILNAAWTGPTGAERHIIQLPVLLVAKTKAAAVEMLTDLGLSEGAAQNLMRQLRATTVLGRDWQMLVDDGVIDLTEPAVYVSNSGKKGSRAVRAVSVDEVRVLGEFGYDPVYGGRGLYFAPA